MSMSSLKEEKEEEGDTAAGPQVVEMTSNPMLRRSPSPTGGESSRKVFTLEDILAMVPADAAPAEAELTLGASPPPSPVSLSEV